MKKATTTLAAMMILGSALCQCTLSEDKIDPFTGQRIVKTKLQKTGDRAPGRDLYVTAATITDEGGSTTVLSLYLLPSPSSCVSSDSKAIFLWADGETETAAHIGGVKCSNHGHMLMVDGGSRILKEDPSAVRLYYSEGYIDVTLKSDAVARHTLCTLLQ